MDLRPMIKELKTLRKENARLRADLDTARGGYSSLYGIEIKTYPVLDPGAFYCHPDTLKTAATPPNEDSKPIADGNTGG